MVNMRIDVIRKELERRYQNILDLKDSNEIVVRGEICKFIYFLLSTDGIREFIRDLARFKDRFKASDNFNFIRKDILKNIKKIVNIIEESKIVDKGVEINLRNHFNLKERVNLSLDEFVDCLKHFDKHFNDVINYLSMVINEISMIFQLADQNKWQYDSSKYNGAYQELLKLNNKLEAHFKLKYQYEGAESALNLLTIFFHPQSQYRHLVNIDEKHLGDDLEESIERFRLDDHVEVIDMVKDCEELYYAVDKFLSTSKSKGFLLDRFITYCTWIKRRDFPKPKEKNKERKISTILEEFIFDHGYFPIVRFKTGKSEPDILTAPGVDLRWDNSILIELKQIIGGKSYSATNLTEDIGQAQDYLKVIRGVKQDIVDMVYLLIFYDGKTRRTVHKSVDVPDNIRVEFVYVGEESPSKLKSAKEN